VLLPVSLRFAVKAIQPKATFLYLLAFPFTPNLFFHMGFYNFCYSLPLFFLLVGYWWKRRDAMSWGETLVLLLLGLIAYFCHLVSLLAAVLVVGACILWLTYFDIRRPPPESDDWRGMWRSLFRRLRGPVAAFLPALVLALWFINRQSGRVRPTESPAGSAWSILIKLEALVSFNRYEGLPAAALSGFILLLALWLLLSCLRRRMATAGDGLLLSAVAFLALYFLMPSALAGGLFIDYRLTLFSFFALVLWFAAQPAIQRARWTLRLVAPACALALLGMHVKTYAQCNEALDDLLLASDAIEPDSIFLTLNFAPAGIDADGKPLSVRVGPFRHLAGYIALRRPVVNLVNYEATTGYFPILYRPEVNPYRLMGQDDKVLDRGLHLVPPRVDFLSYAKQTGKPVDYILIWGLRSEQRSDPWTISIYRQLEAGGYVEVPIPLRRGLLLLYRRNV